MKSTPRKYEIEKYIADWHWDERSHAFAFEVGVFLFGYMDYLAESGLSEATIRKHESNVWNIGILTCQYGYYDAFEPRIFTYPPFFEIEFKRKMGDTPNALRSYESTCNKLAKYVRDKGWKTLPEYDFDMTDDLNDLYIGLRLLETESRRGDKKKTISFQDWIAILRRNYVLELHEVNSREGSLSVCSAARMPYKASPPNSKSYCVRPLFQDENTPPPEGGCEKNTR